MVNHISSVNKLWRAKFFILCDVIFLMRLQGKLEIDHSWRIVVAPYWRCFNVAHTIWRQAADVFFRVPSVVFVCFAFFSSYWHYYSSYSVRVTMTECWWLIEGKWRWRKGKLLRITICIVYETVTNKVFDSDLFPPVTHSPHTVHTHTHTHTHTHKHTHTSW